MKNPFPKSREASLDEPLLIRLFARINAGGDSQVRANECLCALEDFVAKRPHLRLETVNLDENPGSYHEHMLRGIPAIRAYRNEKQVICHELVEWASKKLRIHVDTPPTWWSLEKLRIRDQELPCSREELEWTDLAKIKQARLWVAYTEFRDPEGNVYGPFADGWSTKLYNLGATRDPILARVVGSQDWVPYGRRNRQRPPADFVKPTHEEMDRELERLLAARARIRSQTSAASPPPVAWDCRGFEKIGLSYEGWANAPDPFGGLIVRFGTDAGSSATIHEIPAVQTGAMVSGAAIADLCHFVRLEIDSQARRGIYSKLCWLEEASDEASGILTFEFSHPAANNASGATPNLIGTVVLIPGDSQWFKVGYTVEKPLLVFERTRLEQFIRACQERFRPQAGK